jgi:polyhydroxybutyrate depolymerase
MPEPKRRRRANWKLWWGGFFVIACIFTVVAVIAAARHDLKSRRITIGGLDRTYELHLPAGVNDTQSLPLVVVLHGGMGTGASMARYTGFNAIADREKFIVVYPEALYSNWNDGRAAENIREQQEAVDDIAFIAGLIDALCSEFPIDRTRVYMTGASNGGMMTHRAAIELTDRFAAAAAVIANIPENYVSTTQPKAPLSMMIVNGTADQLVPWDGGDVHVGFRKRGRVASTQQTVDYWVKFNGCGEPTQTNLDTPENDKDSETHSVKRTHSGGENGTEVVVIEVQGGGHAWPGRPQYMPNQFIGKASQDFDATEEIWSFFKTHTRISGSSAATP